MSLSVVIDRGRVSGINMMWERLADIELICKHYSPSAYQMYSIESLFHRLKDHQADLCKARYFYFDLSTWTNVAWRHLARSTVNELEEDSGWIAILERLQGAGVGLSLAFDKKVYSGRLKIHKRNYIKIFGQALVIEAVGSKDFVSEQIELDSDRHDVRQEANVAIKKLPSVDGITVSRDTFLSEMVSAVGFDAVSSDDEIPDVEKKLEDSLKIIGYDSENAEIVKEFVAVVVPLENPNHDEHQSLSIEATPGSIYIGKNCKLPVFAEALVHEADHQRFYEIRRCEPLVKEESTEKFCSPWRMDPRPADGLVSGASAFFRVSKFWHRLLASNYAEVDHEMAGYRSLFTAAQSRDALQTILRSTELTDFGRDYCETLRREVEMLWRSFQSNPHFEAWSIRAAREISEHKHAWATENSLLDAYEQG